MTSRRTACKHRSFFGVPTTIALTRLLMAATALMRWFRLDGSSRREKLLTSEPGDPHVRFVTGGDPYALALSYNVHRRHLTPEQKRELIANVLKATPEKSNNQIAKQVKTHDKAVAKVRGDLEASFGDPEVGEDGRRRWQSTQAAGEAQG